MHSYNLKKSGGIMSSKEYFCYQILKKHSLIVDFDGKPAQGKFPELDPDETYACWKKRVLGDDVSNVVLYAPIEPAGQTKMSTLQSKAGAESFEKVFREIIKAEKERAKSTVARAVENIVREYTTYPLSALEDLVAASNEALEPSVSEFVDGLLMSEKDAGIEEIIGTLLKSYNDAVRSYRAESAKCDQLQSKIARISGCNP